MIKYLKNIAVLVLFAAFGNTYAQTTTSSPYSQYGLGNIKGQLLPQNRAMGGIGTGIRNLGVYNNINLSNPASYSAIKLTTFDIGAATSLTQLSRTGISTRSFNATLSHIAFAIPVTKKSALSFGLTPYSDLGYQYKTSARVDTNIVNYVYSGDGGLSKFYLGYGFLIGKHLSLGFNAGYIFGKLSQSRTTEFPEDGIRFLNSRSEKSNSVTGLNLDYGLQYNASISSKTAFTLGYSGSLGKNINSNTSTVVTRYFKNFTSGEESIPSDSAYYKEGVKSTLKLPASHNIGFSFQQTKWLLGADVNYTSWSDLTISNVNQGLNNSYSVGVGGQYTPDISAVSNYFKLIDYRMGFKYDKTYISIRNSDIKQMALTLGLGLPLPSNRTSFYKFNLGAELGQRGSLSNNLVRERFVNIYLGFTLNDQWFQKYKFD